MKTLVNEDVKMLKSRDALTYPVFYLLKMLRYAFEKQRCHTSVNQAHFSFCVSVEVLGTLCSLPNFPPLVVFS